MKVFSVTSCYSQAGLLALTAGTHETTGLFAFQIKSDALDWDVDEQLFGLVPWKISRKKQN